MKQYYWISGLCPSSNIPERTYRFGNWIYSRRQMKHVKIKDENITLYFVFMIVNLGLSPQGKKAY
jgi:hypothetical protein